MKLEVIVIDSENKINEESKVKDKDSENIIKEYDYIGKLKFLFFSFRKHWIYEYMNIRI